MVSSARDSSQAAPGATGTYYAISPAVKKIEAEESGPGESSHVYAKS